MPTIIYTDNPIGANGLPINTTPGATYIKTDLASILDCIARGEIQCGTGQPYPVDWNTSPDEQLPWEDGPASSIPWKNY